jgi:ATP-dependent phosphofructokinase / diphosphate-dependent phosphofructokinase
MANTLEGNAVVGQSGGPTAVINQSLVGVIEAVNKCGAIGRLLGAKHGVRGIVEEKFIDLKDLPGDLLERVAATPASALGSSRDKPDAAYGRRIVDVFARNNVRYFFYIGGNDSADTARIVNEESVKAGYELRAFHVPKTIDNDLRVTDHCPGYGSAARFVAAAFMGDDRDGASLPGIKINIVMGRDAGWLTAAAALGRQDDKDGPHLVYVPEVPFALDRFIEDVSVVYDRLGRCQVAVSEGIRDKDNNPVAVELAEKLGQVLERDKHGNVQLSGTGMLGDFLASYVKKSLKGKYEGLRVRADTFGYLQRSFPGFASPVDQAEARACGRTAVELATAGCHDGSVAIQRVNGAKYQVTYIRAELKDVARVTKSLPAEYLSPAGNHVSKAFINYALPLTGGLPEIGKLF